MVKHLVALLSFVAFIDVRVVVVAAQAIDVMKVVQEAADTMAIAKFAALSTKAADGTINGRIIYPKPPNATGSSPDLLYIYFATSKYSRKYKEIDANPNSTLVYYEDAGKGEVTLKGSAVICNATEAKEQFYDKWYRSYPQGPETPMYTLIRFETKRLEFASYVRFHVDEGNSRQDWRPLTLERPSGGQWQYIAPPPALQEIEL